MSKLKKTKWDSVDAIALIGGFACLLGALYILQGGPEKPKVHNTHIDTSIVRLHDVETGRFFCSGVVISDTQILTAAHCVVRQGFFSVEVVRKVEIRAADDTKLNLYATLNNANPRQDVALLDGHFTLFDHMEVEIKPQSIEDSFLRSRHLKACGFPAGGALVCSALTHVAHQNFGFTAEGFLYPGMSGGPVIDEQTGKVIAVNTAVDGARVYLSPTEELFNQLRP